MIYRRSFSYNSQSLGLWWCATKLAQSSKINDGNR